MVTEALSHFAQVDPLLYAEAKHIQLPKLTLSTDYFKDLCDAIIGQQLSGKAASTIFGRFEQLFPDQRVDSEIAEQLSIEQMRAIGVSNAKASYIHDLAWNVNHGKLKIKQLDSLSDEEIKRELTAVKGIGPWTAEMFLIFALCRDDIFSAGDLGLKKGIQKVYKLAYLPTEKQALEYSLKWEPYRSFASRFLWKLLDTEKDT